MHNSVNSSPVTDDKGRTYAEQKAARKASWKNSYKKAKMPKPQKQHHQPNTNNSWSGPRPTPNNSWGDQRNSPTGAPQYKSVFGNSPQPINTPVSPMQNLEGEQAAQSALIWGILSAILVFTFAFSLIGFVFGIIGFRKAKKARELGYKASGGYWLNLSSIIFGGLNIVLSIFGIFISILHTL